ncbi:c-type cytochrome biogenesis protein CcsB [Cellulomonas humilata]|uniref:C-type cytochrome biogenesis protein CcsB n=1 Tax=Cellulomonas humilata TaxID=144055 RepID=A0A7Y6DWI6_9CELL|nr:c-type cytochrome biogenesis protein CcsB [Cellulomonas humilata]NUU16012.1 c-type cytochrome biogenesis protein CcsB [Cellulomonas humilata]
MTTGDLSTLLVWGAATAFTVALIAFSTDLARIAERAQRRVPELATAGAAPARGARPATAVSGSEEQSAPGRSVRAEGIARSTTLLGLLMLFAGIVLRGIAAGRWPTANMYEFTIVGVFVAVLVLTVVQRRRIIAFVGVLVMGMAVLALVLALNAFFIQADQVQPALQSYWLIIHVGVAITATGIFTVAFAASVLQVLKSYREEAADAPAVSVGPSGEPVAASASSAATSSARRSDRFRRVVSGRRFGWLEQVPGSRELEAMSFRLNAIAFVLWTLTLIGGAIWAEHAWGRYWGWDPKEVGTFVAWVVYAAYLHARTTRGWSGRRAAYFVFVGYAVVLANFTVVNLVVTGKHSYSGV